VKHRRSRLPRSYDGFSLKLDFDAIHTSGCIPMNSCFIEAEVQNRDGRSEPDSPPLMGLEYGVDLDENKDQQLT
jgi:hypothetical protein